MAKQANVISHWSQLIECFHTSPLGFYQSLQKAIEERAVPEFHSARIEHKEGGLASSNRAYLRIHRGKHAFDICAAPFGTGFFISWWFTEPPLPFAFLYTIAFLFGVTLLMNFAFIIGVGVGAVTLGVTSGFFFGMIAAVFGVPIVLWFFGNAMRIGAIPGESTVLAMPLIGRIYEWVFSPETFYKIDTALMFQGAVHNAVLEVIDCVTKDKGVRALSESERKPILKAFAASTQD